MQSKDKTHAVGYNYEVTYIYKTIVLSKLARHVNSSIHQQLLGYIRALNTCLRKWVAAHHILVEPLTKSVVTNSHYSVTYVVI